MLINSTTTPGFTLKLATSRQTVLWYGFCTILLWMFVSPLLFDDSFFRMNTDEANYVWKAEQISRDLGTIVTERAWRRHPPLIPLVVGLLAKITSLQFAFLATTKLFAVVGILLVYVVGVQFKGPFAGLIAAVILACDPTYRALSNKLLLDIPLMILFVLCASLLLRGGRYRGWAIATGILALFVKDYGVLVLVYALACITWDFLSGRGWQPSFVVGIIAASCVIILAPLGYVLGHIPCCDWISWITWLSHEAKFKFWHVLDNSVGWIIPAVQKRYVAAFLLLAVPFIIKMLSYSTTRANVILFGWIGTILGPFLFAYSGDERVILLFAPALYLLVGVCAAQGLQLIKNPTMTRSVGAVISALCVFFLLVAQKNPEVLYYTECRFRAYYPTGKWIRQTVSPYQSLVLTRSSHQLRFYAGSDFEKEGGMFFGEDEWSGIPQTVSELQQVLDNTSKTTYLIVDIETKTDPAWLYPPSRQAAEVLHTLGFSAVHVVWLPVGERCDIPDSPYYSELQGFLKHVNLSLYRITGGLRERVGAVVFQRKGLNPVITYGMQH